MLTSIAGKSVVVTGASKGIGKGIARVFARNGAKVTIVARHRAEAEAAAKELGGEASAALADVTNLAELEKMAKSAARAEWRHRRALRQCRDLPAGEDRGHDAGAMGRRCSAPT